DRRILHVLNRLAFGPRPGDVARVRAVGLDAWIDRQLRPETIDDSATERALVDLASLRMSISEALREYPRPDPKLREKLQNGRMTRTEMMETYPPEKRPFRIAAELQAAKTLRAVKSERQLAEVMVDFWFNHFNVFAGKGDVRWYVSAYERDVIRPNALGRFPDLVRATARHPALLAAPPPGGGALRPPPAHARHRREGGARPPPPGRRRSGRRRARARDPDPPSLDGPLHRHEARPPLRGGYAAARARRPRRL